MTSSGRSPRGPASRADYRAHREAILRAAQTVLTRAERGTIADVALEAGLTRATVYRHFPDRDALLDGLVEQLAVPFVDDLLDVLEHPSLASALERLAHLVVGHIEQHRDLVRVLAPRLEELARTTIGDEPLASVLDRRRAAGELVVEMSDAWLAASIRSLCLIAVFDERPVAEVADDLACSLRRLVA